MTREVTCLDVVDPQNVVVLRHMDGTVDFFLELLVDDVPDPVPVMEIRPHTAFDQPIDLFLCIVVFGKERQLQRDPHFVRVPPILPRQPPTLLDDRQELPEEKGHGLDTIGRYGGSVYHPGFEPLQRPRGEGQRRILFFLCPRSRL